MCDNDSAQIAGIESELVCYYKRTWTRVYVVIFPTEVINSKTSSHSSLANEDNDTQ